MTREAPPTTVDATGARPGGGTPPGFAPSFRSPPRTSGRDRALRRRADGSVSVAVRLSGRPFVAVVADMIEGTIAANRLEGQVAEDLRRRLWAAVESTQGEVLSAA